MNWSFLGLVLYFVVGALCLSALIESLARIVGAR